MSSPEWRAVTPAQLTEYQAVKSDAAQARNSQQAILSWSLGGIGAAAGLLLSASHLAHGVLVVAFGLWLPGLIAGAAFAWIGELVRMEKSASYARALERATWPPECRDGDVRSEWIDNSKYQLVYENVLRFTTPHPLYGSPMRIGYVGGALIYILSYVCCMAIASYYSVLYGVGAPFVPVGDALLTLAFLSYVGVFAHQLLRLSTSALRPLGDADGLADGAHCEVKSAHRGL